MPPSSRHTQQKTHWSLSTLPPEFRTVRWVGSRYPGSPSVARSPGLADGANCQHYAYSVLRHFGYDPPELRSSEFWTDTTVTIHVPVPAPLDVLLFNDTPDPYGAHFGLWTPDGRVLHLNAEIGSPVIWPLPEFATRPEYAVLLGAKRVTRKMHFVDEVPANGRSRVPETGTSSTKCPGVSGRGGPRARPPR